jgi:hypothetical protein
VDDVSLVLGPLICDVGKVVLISDRSVGLFSLGLSVVSREPLLGRNWRRLSGLVGLACREFGGGPFGGSSGCRGVGIPGCAGLVGLG